MILKIQDAFNLKKWIYYDNIAKISINYNEYIIDKDEKILQVNTSESSSNPLFELDVDAIFAKWDEKEDNEFTVLTVHAKNRVVVAIFRVPHDEYCVAFNSRAYLLNDEGKTIERIS